MKHKPLFFILVFFVVGLTVLNIPFAVASPAYEDFTTYVVYEASNDVDVFTNHIDFYSTRSINDEAYVYKDKGVDFFNTFQHNVTARSDFAASYCTGIFYGLANDIDNFRDLNIDSKTFIALGFNNNATHNRIRLHESYAGSIYSQAFAINASQWYYIHITKSGKNLNVYVYANVEHTTLLHTFSLTLQVVHKFQYVYALSSWAGWGTGQWQNIDIDNLDLNLLEYSVTFFFNEGGEIRVNNATTANGTTTIYGNGTAFEIASLTLNASYVFLNFSWNTGNSTTNPYDLTVLQNLNVTCYFSSVPSGGLMYGLFFFGIVIGLVVGVLLGFGSKKI